MTITVLGAAQVRAALNEFVTLLQDAVADGATIGFIAPLGVAEARAYWELVIERAERGERAVLAALEHNEIVGTAQLVHARLPASRHRGEIEKLLVRSDVRGRGIGRALLDEVERTAEARECTLVMLNTERGSAAETMYERAGYRRGGVIPHYARDPKGALTDAVFFYKEIGD